MVDQDVMFEKVKQIQQCLNRIRDKTVGRPESLDSVDIQDIFVLNLQRAVQSSIDLAAHVVADENLGLPGDMREGFSILEREGVFSKELSEKLQHMVGFRNIAIHDYSVIDVTILKSILQKHLQDLEDFCSAILRRYASPKK